MTVIGVISDTHLPENLQIFPETLLDGLQKVDFIIHAGDINRGFVAYDLGEIAPLQGVAGNTDDDFILSIFGRKKLIEVEGCRIGVIHGDGNSGTTFTRVQSSFKNDNVDCVIFGHSHIPSNEIIDGVLYFNPGSPFDKRNQEKYSFGELIVTGNRIEGKLQYF